MNPDGLALLFDQKPEISLWLKETKDKPEPGIFCTACGVLITRPRFSIKVNGSHLHDFKNPAGILYRISCFSAAEGCLVAGEQTPEFSWFPPYMWSFALCGSCHIHLGWHYNHGADCFFGLIADRLTER